MTWNLYLSFSFSRPEKETVWIRRSQKYWNPFDIRSGLYKRNTKSTLFNIWDLLISNVTKIQRQKFEMLTRIEVVCKIEALTKTGLLAPPILKLTRPPPDGERHYNKIVFTWFSSLCYDIMRWSVLISHYLILKTLELMKMTSNGLDIHDIKFLSLKCRFLTAFIFRAAYAAVQSWRPQEAALEYR